MQAPSEIHVRDIPDESGSELESALTQSPGPFSAPPNRPEPDSPRHFPVKPVEHHSPAQVPGDDLTAATDGILTVFWTLSLRQTQISFFIFRLNAQVGGLLHGYRREKYAA